MNALTKVTAKGTASIPKDVLERMCWTSGTELQIVEQAGSVTLRPKKWHNPFPRTTSADIAKWKPAKGPAKSIEEISSLSDDALRRIFAEQERDARD